jgi:hypothetical protein
MTDGHDIKRLVGPEQRFGGVHVRLNVERIDKRFLVYTLIQSSALLPPYRHSDVYIVTQAPSSSCWFWPNADDGHNGCVECVINPLDGAISTERHGLNHRP